MKGDINIVAGTANTSPIDELRCYHKSSTS